MSWPHLGAPAAYVLLACFALLADLRATVRLERPPFAAPEIDRRFSWKSVAPVPRELRVLLRRASSGHSSLEALADADYQAHFSPAIERIRNGG
jgi:hypothetical protein